MGLSREGRKEEADTTESELWIMSEWEPLVKGPNGMLFESV